MSQQAELLDLPEEEEKPKIKILTPKLIILIALAAYFVGNNVYVYMNRAPLSSPPPQIDRSKQFWEMYDRFKNYVIVALIGFIVFYFLRKANNEHQYEVYLKKQKEQQQIEQERNKKIREQEERILRKIEQEEKKDQERQLRMAASNLPKAEEEKKEESCDEEKQEKQKIN